MIAVCRMAAASAGLTQSPAAVFPSGHLTCAFAALGKSSKQATAASKLVRMIRLILRS
jgi:hypothetical protein